MTQFVLMNALETFQMMRNEVLKGLPCARFHLDDIAIFSKDFANHIKDVKAILKQISAAKISLKLEKRSFASTKEQLIGHVVSKDGISDDSKKIMAISEAPIPYSRIELQRFLGLH